MNDANVYGPDRRPRIVDEASDAVAVWVVDHDFFVEFAKEAGLVSLAARVAVLAADMSSDADGPKVVQAIFAARFAAKEACAKALGTGFNRGVHMRDEGISRIRFERIEIFLVN